MTDEETLIAASKRGDSTALDTLVRAHQDRVYAFAMWMCRNVEDAKGILTWDGAPLRRCGGAT
jgi:DNA-directed RNA polymerase specialized sigma24 family protein